MTREPSLYRTVAAAAGFLAALIALIVLVLATRDAGAPGGPTSSLEPACLDFATQKEAQRFYEAEGGPERDDHGLDSDGDGFACDAMASARAAETVTLDDFVLTQVTATATPTSTATPSPSPTARPTTTPGATSRPSPRAGVLPKSGAQSAQMAIAGMSLVTTGMFGVTMYNARNYVLARRRRREEEAYDFIGW